MKVQVSNLQAGDRIWHNGDTELVSAVTYSDLSETFTVTFSDGDRVIVRETKSFDRVA